MRSLLLPPSVWEPFFQKLGRVLLAHVSPLSLQHANVRWTESLTSIATVTKELGEPSAASLLHSSSLATFQFLAIVALLRTVISNVCLLCRALCHRRSLPEKHVGSSSSSVWCAALYTVGFYQDDGFLSIITRYLYTQWNSNPCFDHTLTHTHSAYHGRQSPWIRERSSIELLLRQLLLSNQHCF